MIDISNKSCQCRYTDNWAEATLGGLIVQQQRYRPVIVMIIAGSYIITHRSDIDKNPQKCPGHKNF